jgi:hypothetical protein
MAPCTPVYRIRECDSEVDIYISSNNSLVIGTKYFFVNNDTQETICAQVEEKLYPPICNQTPIYNGETESYSVGISECECGFDTFCTTENCCYRITNCETEESYLIKFGAAQTFQVGNIYKLEDFFNNPSVLSNKCWQLQDLEPCEFADFNSVQVVTDYGTECITCNDAQKFFNCETNQEIFISTIDISTGSVSPGNIYTLNGGKDQLDGCWTYLGYVQSVPYETQIISANVNQDLGSQQCVICTEYYEIQDCVTEEILSVRFNGTYNPDSSLEGYEDIGGLQSFYGVYASWIGKIIKIYGDEAVDGKCYTFLDIKTNLETIVDYEELGGTFVYPYGAGTASVQPDPSEDCYDCCLRYLLTDCIDPENQIEIIWDCVGTVDPEPLDESLVYRFDSVDIDPNTCWTVELIPNPPIYFNRI